jgi:hypothetical protein
MFSLCLGCSCTEKVKSWWKSVLCYKAGCEEGCCYANAQRGCPLEQAKVLINHCFFSHSFSSHVFISMNCYGQVNNGSLIAYEKVYCIQGVVKFIESCTLGYIG